MTPEIERALECLFETALKWADASARDPEEVEIETRELRVKLLGKAWHLRSVCRESSEQSTRTYSIPALPIDEEDERLIDAAASRVQAGERTKKISGGEPHRKGDDDGDVG